MHKWPVFPLSCIERTPDIELIPVEHMGIDHGGPDIPVAEQFLYRTDVITILKEVRGKRMAESMTGSVLGNA